MSKRILVTGGTGFIGSNLCKKLISMGEHVVCLDNLYCSSVDNVSELIGNPSFTFVKRNVEDPNCWLEVGTVDQIYNLACPASPVHYQCDQVQTIVTTVLGAVNVLNYARMVNATVLQASTSEVYGDPDVHPQSESYWGNVNPLGERSCYDEGKRCSESLFVNYWKQYGVKVKIVRIFNTYGPNMAIDDGRVISNFIVQALHNNDVTIFGDGMQTRSFQYIDDLLEGMMRMMNDTSDDFIGPVNIGNPDERTMCELAKMIIAKTGSRSKITFHSLPNDDPKRRCPDITLAEKVLDGWHPTIDVNEGLDRTIEYFRKKLNIL